jgi:hypothetical protein
MPFRAVGMLILLFAASAPGGSHVLAAPGDSPSDPAPLGTEIVAGPWRLTVAEVVTGEDATDLVLEASSVNEAPRDGFTYVAVRVTAVNDGDQPLEITGDDFALTTGSGDVRRFTGAVPPDPALDGVAQPGESRDGWLVLGAPVDVEMLLLFDSVSLPGDWADRVFALSDGATLDPADAPLSEANEVGQTPDDPAGIGDTIVTDAWEIELLGIASCEEVYEMSDFRVQALPEGDAYDEAPWLAINVKITNIQAGNDPAYLSSTAFMIVESDGSTTPNVITLTAPSPDAAGAYYPGATRDGWVAFELPSPYVDSGTTLIRFLPFRGESDERFITFGEEWSDCRR